MSEVIDLLADLIAIDSVNPDLVPGGAGESRIAGFVSDWFVRHGFTIQRLEARPGRPSIVAISKGTGGGRSLMLNGHLDVVGVGGYVGDPFRPHIEDGKISGRGSIDMKAGVAAMMIAAARVAARRPKGDILVACVADEEFASIGSEAVAAAFNPDAVIVTEPTDLAIVITHKGFVWFDIAVEGKAAHGSRPDLGIDAIAKAGHFLVALDAFGRQLLAGRPVPLLGTGSVHASMIAGGQEMSSYPDTCLVRIERRTVPGETVAEVEAQIAGILTRLTREVPDFKARLVRGLSREPLPEATDSDLVALLESAAGRRGLTPRRAGMTGWTDCALFAAKGIPAVLFGPTGGGLHATTEWADVASVEATADILEATALAFCNGGVT